MASIACILGEHPLRLWGLSSRERLERQLRAAGFSDITVDPHQASAAHSVVIVHAAYLFEQRTISALAKQQDALLECPLDNGLAGAACSGARVLEFVAEHIRSNVRRLHGSLFRLGSWLSLHGTPSLADTEEILRDILADEAKNQITIDLIQRTVADFYDIRLADMTSRKRPAQIAKARQLAMYLTREHIGSSYMEIGDAFGGRDHATVMHACRVMEAQLPVDEKLRHAVTEIERTLQRSSNRN